MEHVVVAGGAGFLGSHLCDLLLAREYKVTAIDNLITGTIDNIAHNLGNPNFKFVQQDVSQAVYIDDPVDGVLNLASPASPIDYLHLPIETLRVGAMGTQHLLELARANKAVFLLASTSEIYGDPLEHPQKEDYWGNVNPIGPRSVYDESKRYAEALTMAYHRTFGVEVRIARIFNTYGPRMRLNDGRVVPAMVSQALMGEPITVFGDGLQTRSFCYVADEVEGIYRLFKSNCGEPVNIGNPTEMTVMQFAQMIQDVTGSHSDIVFKPLPIDDPAKRKPDISKAKQILSWQPQVLLEDGLKQTIEYFRPRVLKATE